MKRNGLSGPEGLTDTHTGTGGGNGCHGDSPIVFSFFLFYMYHDMKTCYRHYSEEIINITI